MTGATLLLMAIYWNTVGSLWVAWSRDPLGHGYIVVPAALYLVWIRRGDVAAVRPRPAFSLLPLLALIAGLWLLGNLASSSTLQQLCLVLMFLGFVWGTLGTAVVRTLMLPIGLLFFALPVGDLFVPTLQSVTARAAVSGLQISGIAAHLQGTVISVPGGSWEVAWACSGINYLMSSLVIAYLYAGLVYRSWINRIGLIVTAVPIALFANTLRVYVTIVAASLGAHGVATGLKHEAMGWIVFAAILWAMFEISRVFPDRPSAVRFESSPGVGSSPAPTSSRQTLAFVGVALLIVNIAPLSARHIWLASEAVVVTQPRALAVRPGWEAIVGGPGGQVAGSPRPSAEMVQTYRRGEHIVKLIVARYFGRGEREQMPPRPGQAQSTAGWVNSLRSRPITLNDQTVDVAEMIRESPGLSTVQWTWYSVDGALTSGWFGTKLLLAKSRLLSTGADVQVFILTSHAETVDRGVAILEDFVAHVAGTESAQPVQ